MNHLSLTENHLFGKAYTGGMRFSGRYVCVFVLRDKAAYRLKKANPQKEYLNRLGITVSKKVGCAVVRTRARRIIRAAFTQIENAGLKRGYIIVISARENITGRKTDDVVRELLYAFTKLGMLSEKPKL